jgi:hypothetical protein
MNRLSIARATALSLCAASVIVVSSRAIVQGEPNQLPGVGGIHWARDHQPANPGNGHRSPNLTWHGGPVMHGTFVEPIFWGASWSGYSGDKVTGMQSFYSGMGSTSYAGTNSEYTDGAGHVDTGITLGATYFDFSTVNATGQTTSPILAKVCANITNPVANGYYPVYTDRPRGNAGFCAWHSAGTCGGVPVQFAFFFKLDGDPGCDPQDASGLHSQGLAAIANVSGHELSEALTDPRLNAWYDSSGSENADKCAWSFGTPLLTFSDGSQWKIQGNWSNAAYNASTGFTNTSGQRGCLDGGNF